MDPQIDDAGNVFEVVTSQRVTTLKKRSRQRKKSDKAVPIGAYSVRLQNEILLKPETMHKVEFETQYPLDESDGYVEKVMSMHKEDRNIWGIADGVVSSQSTC